jgi:hypothetical protein
MLRYNGSIGTTGNAGGKGIPHILRALNANSSSIDPQNFEHKI